MRSFPSLYGLGLFSFLAGIKLAHCYHEGGDEAICWKTDLTVPNSAPVHLSDCPEGMDIILSEFPEEETLLSPFDHSNIKDSTGIVIITATIFRYSYRCTVISLWRTGSRRIVGEGKAARKSSRNRNILGYVVVYI